MISVKKKLSASALLILLLSAVGAVLRTAALFGCYDTAIGYYRTSAILPDIFHILCVAVLAISAFLAIWLPSAEKIKYSAPGFGESYVRAGAAFALCGMSTYLFYLVLGALGDTAIYKKTNTSGMLELLALIMGIVAVFYFVLILASKLDRENYYVLFAYAMVVFLLLAVSFTYFDYYTVMNGPNKMLLQITILVIMFYMINEQRFALGKAKPRLHAFFTLAAFYFCAVCSLPYIIAFFGGAVKNLAFLFYHFMILGYGVYIGTRAYSFIASQKGE